MSSHKKTREDDIEVFKHLFERCWKRFPEMRFCQLIETILAMPLSDERCGHTVGADHFYIADGDFHRHMLAFAREHKIH